MAQVLTKMCLESSVVDEKTIAVKVPMTRSDILHPCDVVEDIAIAYGYNNIPKRLPLINSSAKMQPLNHFTDLLR